MARRAAKRPPTGKPKVSRVTSGYGDVMIPLSRVGLRPKKAGYIQSGASSLAKHGGAYFSAVCGSIQDPIAAPGPYENQEF